MSSLSTLRSGDVCGEGRNDVWGDDGDDGDEGGEPCSMMAGGGPPELSDPGDDGLERSSGMRATVPNGAGSSVG